MWVQHLRSGEARLAALLAEAGVLCHPFVIGELACGHLRRRTEILALLAALPVAVRATHDEALALIERQRLQGRGLGWVDVNLLASCALTGAPLWTLDVRLAAAAAKLGLALD